MMRNTILNSIVHIDENIDLRVDQYGQSNLGGFTNGVVAPDEYENPSPDAYFIGRKYDDTPVSTFTVLTRDNTLGSTHGAELSLAKELERVWMVKVYRGGSSISILSKGNFFDVYGQFIELVQSAETQQAVNKRVFYYNQWEGDSSTATETYRDLFIQLVTDIETDGGFTYDLIVAVKARDQDSTDYQNIVDAQNELVTYYNGRYILLDADDLQKLDDDVHYTSDSQITLGNRLATIIESN